jgi:hypothetical protein
VPQPSSTYADPLDLLRRFVPTPFKAVYRINSLLVAVQTNDIALLPAMPLETTTPAARGTYLAWKLIRDPDTPGLLAPPTVLNCGALTVAEMGTACLIAFDREQKHLLAFIGADVDGRTHQDFLIPFLCRMTNESALSGDTNELFSPLSSEIAND